MTLLVCYGADVVWQVGARAQVENRLREKRTAMKQKAAMEQQQQRSGGSSSSSTSSSSGSSNANSWLLPAAAAGDVVAAATGIDEYSWLDDKDLIWQVSMSSHVSYVLLLKITSMTCAWCRHFHF